MTGALAPADVALAAQMAALLEVSAPKPGNVSRAHDFGDTTFEDFLLSAAAIGPALAEAGRIGVGASILRAVEATRRWARANTNLGIVLLFAPLAAAAAREGGALRTRLAAVLSELTVGDAELAYAAIRLASPGGLGEATEQDVRQAPTVTLRQAMALAAERDTVAREYVTDFAATFELAAPALRRARESGAPWPQAILGAYLETLAALPDTLIARRRGEAAARRVTERAAAALRAGGPGSAERAAAVERLDRELRSDGNALNPGTTADVVACAIFVTLLEETPDATE